MHVQRGKLGRLTKLFLSTYTALLHHLRDIRSALKLYDEAYNYISPSLRGLLTRDDACIKTKCTGSVQFRTKDLGIW